jgi:hypothetical protein
MENFESATLTLTAEQFAVLSVFISNIRLGDRNIYENAISDLAIVLENSGSVDYLNDFYKYSGLRPPTFMVECSEEDGLIFNVMESIAG